MMQLNPHTHATFAPVRSASVLVGEDDVATRRLPAEALEATGFRRSPMRVGFAALSGVRNTAAHVVVLDLAPPSLDGREFPDALRIVEPSQRVPIPVWSARTQLPPSLASVLGHTTEPFDIDIVVAGERRLVARERAR